MSNNFLYLLSERSTPVSVALEVVQLLASTNMTQVSASISIHVRCIHHIG